MTRRSRSFTFRLAVDRYNTLFCCLCVSEGAFLLLRCVQSFLAMKKVRTTISFADRRGGDAKQKMARGSKNESAFLYAWGRT